MRRRSVLVGLGSAVPVMGIYAVDASAAATSRQSLERQVRALVDRYAAAWNASDMAAMGALYTPDVHWVNIVGMHWQGFEEVDFAHRALFDSTFKGVPQTFEEIESIAPMPNGGAVAVVRWAVASYTTPSGQAMPRSRTRMSLTLVPHGDELRIAHGANIQIVEPAQRSDPVVQRREKAKG